jgi:D-alanyl-D-alanine carboxypeptidase
MTLPHAAGSMASNVDDMAAWDAALYTEGLVRQESLSKAWTPHTLPNGMSAGYGYGWAVGTFQDHHMVMHAGGINGFTADAIRFPRERVYVCILTNRAKEIPDDLAFRIGAIVTGKPFEEPVTVLFDPTLYPRYEGVYHEKCSAVDVSITEEDGNLSVAFPGGPKQELIPLSRTEFAWKDRATRVVSSSTIPAWLSL